MNRHSYKRIARQNEKLLLIADSEDLAAKICNPPWYATAAAIAHHSVRVICWPAVKKEKTALRMIARRFREIGQQFVLRWSDDFGLAATAAYGCAIEANAAKAAGFHAGRHAIAAGLQHGAARLVATGASDAAAIFGHFAGAIAHGEVALAHDHAVLHATAAAQAIAQHFAQILHRSARHLVVAGADHLHATSAFLHANGTARRHR